MVGWQHIRDLISIRRTGSEEVLGTLANIIHADNLLRDKDGIETDKLLINKTLSQYPGMAGSKEDIRCYMK